MTAAAAADVSEQPNAAEALAPPSPWVFPFFVCGVVVVFFLKRYGPD